MEDLVHVKSAIVWNRKFMINAGLAHNQFAYNAKKTIKFARNASKVICYMRVFAMKIALDTLMMSSPYLNALNVQKQTNQYTKTVKIVFKVNVYYVKIASMNVRHVKMAL